MYSTDWNDKKKNDDFYPYRSDLPIILYAAVEIKYYFCTGMAKCYRIQKAVSVTKTPQWSNTNHTQLSTLITQSFTNSHTLLLEVISTAAKTWLLPQGRLSLVSLGFIRAPSRSSFGFIW